MERLFARLRERFDLVPGADVAVENDPREFNPDLVETMARVGVTRASLGLQDVDPQVQRAVNRVQSMDETARVANALRGAGIASINIDLMYGLPYQTVARVLTTIEAVLDLGPEHICLFGYAHVPWMKRHQRRIDEAAQQVTSLPVPAVVGTAMMGTALPQNRRRRAAGRRSPGSA